MDGKHPQRILCMMSCKCPAWLCISRSSLSSLFLKMSCNVLKCPAIAHQFLTHNHWRDGSGIYQHRGVWFHLGGCRFGVSNWFRLFIALTSFKPCSRTCGCCKGCHTDTCKEPWGVKTGITLTPAKNHWVGGSQRASHWHPLRTIGGEGHKGRHTDTHKEPLGVFSR